MKGPVPFEVKASLPEILKAERARLLKQCVLLYYHQYYYYYYQINQYYIILLIKIELTNIIYYNMVYILYTIKHIFCVCLMVATGRTLHV